jgi:hypothetical protein
MKSSLTLTDMLRQAIQNMYHSDLWRARLWHLGRNESALPVDAQPHLATYRAQRLKFCQDGIGLSAQWETRLKMIIARVEVCYRLWVALGEKISSGILGPLICNC